MSRTKRTQRGRRTELSEHQTLETRLEHYRREGKEHRMRTLIWGTVGSIMIMLGSYGSGWLADSSDFWRSSIIRTIRYDPSWIIACVVLVAAGGMIMCREWLRIYQKVGTDASSRRWIYAVIACWSTPQLFAFTLFSRDMFSYYGQGQVIANGLDPYKHGVSEITNFFQNGADPLWAQSPPPYGPVFIKIEQFIVWVADGNIDAALFMFRLVSALSFLGIMYYAVGLAGEHGYSRTRTLWQVGANPLFIASFVSSGHNDSMMTLFMVASLYIAKRHRTFWGGMAAVTVLALGVAVKPLALVVLPFVGLLWAGEYASWPRRFVYWALSLVVLFTEMWLMGAVTGLGFGWVSALSTTAGQFIWFTPLGLVIGAVVTAPGVSPETADHYKHIIEYIGKGLGMAGAILFAFFGRDREIVRRAGLAIIVMLVLSPMIQPWYLLWALPMIAATGIRTNFQLMWYFATTVFFMALSVSDQLAISPYLLDFDKHMAQLIAGLVCLGYVLYLLLLDPGTHALTRNTLMPKMLLAHIPRGSMRTRMNLKRAKAEYAAAKLLRSEQKKQRVAKAPSASQQAHKADASGKQQEGQADTSVHNNESGE